MKSYNLSEEKVASIFNHEEGYTTLEETMESIAVDEVLIAYTRENVELFVPEGTEISDELLEHVKNGDYSCVSENMSAYVDEFLSEHANTEVEAQAEEKEEAVEA